MRVDFFILGFSITSYPKSFYSDDGNEYTLFTDTHIEKILSFKGSTHFNLTRSVECTKTKLNTQKESKFAYELDSFYLPIQQPLGCKNH